MADQKSAFVQFIKVSWLSVRTLGRNDVFKDDTEPTLCRSLRSFPGAQHAPPVAAQDLTSVFKAGYLEKRRKGETPTI